MGTKIRRKDVEHQTSVALTIFVFGFGGTKTFFIRVWTTCKQIKNKMTNNFYSLSKTTATHTEVK